MATYKEIYTSDEVIDAIEAYGDLSACAHYSDFYDDSQDGAIRPEMMNKFFVVSWPEHCRTRQHIGDASIHGPYESREEAEEIHLS